MGSPSPEPRTVTTKSLEGEVDGRIKNRFARLTVLDQDTHVYRARAKRVRCRENANDERARCLARAHHSAVGARDDRSEHRGHEQHEANSSMRHWTIPRICMGCSRTQIPLAYRPAATAAHGAKSRSEAQTRGAKAFATRHPT